MKAPDTSAKYPQKDRLRNESTPAVSPPQLSTKLIRQNVTTIDVTTNFAIATSRLPNGTLIKDESLGLFESVSAIEIGEPKMDSGVLDEDNNLDDEYDVSKPVSAEEAIWLMDELLCCEVAWHMGYPLSQTLFTSVHVNRLLWPDPKTVVDARFGDRNSESVESGILHSVVRSYCLALIKACDLVRTMVVSQHFYEEEDFTTQLFHRELLHCFDLNIFYDSLNDAQSWLDNAQIDPHLNTALSSRLTLRRDILQMLDAHRRAFEMNQPSAVTLVSTCRKLESSTTLGQPIRAAFSLKIQRDLASSVPPKPIITVPREQAFTFLHRLFLDASHSYELLQSCCARDMLDIYWTFMSQNLQPSVYVRSLVQSFVADDQKILGQWKVQAFILDDIHGLVLPYIIQSSTRDSEASKTFQIQKLLNEFANKSSQSYMNIIRSFCLNRCRTRRTLCHAIVDWDQLQVEAEEFDSLLQDLVEEQPRRYPVGASLTYAYPLSSWVYHYKLLQMEIIAQVDFELSVYALDEMAQMYWYISHLVSVHLCHLDRISFFVEKSPFPPSTASTGTSQHHMTNLESRRKKCLEELFHMYTQLKGTESLARALHYTFVFLIRHNLVRKLPRPYASNKLRYELRLKPFLPISVPEPPTFEEFNEQTNLIHISDGELLEEATRAASQAKKAWEQVLRNPPTFGLPRHRATRPATIGTTYMDAEWVNDVKDTIRSCIATGIVVSTLKARVRDRSIRDTTVRVPDSKTNGSWHRWWIVPKVVDIEKQTPLQPTNKVV